MDSLGLKRYAGEQSKHKGTRERNFYGLSYENENLRKKLKDPKKTLCRDHFCVDKPDKWDR